MHTTSSRRSVRGPGGAKALSQDAQSVLELLIQGLEGDNTHRTIDNNEPGGGIMPVTVERVGARQWSVAHYHLQAGDSMRDPEVVFWKGDDDRYYPCQWTQDGMPGLAGFQQLIEFDDVGAPTRVMTQQRSCATFCATWMANIKEQQGLKKPRGRPPGARPLVAPPPEAPPPAPAMDAREVEVDVIDPNPNQPRKVFDQDKLRELATSILANKLQQPIKLRPKADGRFEIVMGERRWRAHKLAGLRTIKAFVEEMTDDQMADAAIIENLQRLDISPLEEARAFQARLDTGLSVEELARRLGISQPRRITERTCLLKLFPEYQEAFAQGHLRPSDAYELAQLEGDYQRALFNAIRDGRCKTAGTLRAVAQAFRDAQSNKLPVLVVQNRDTQTDMFPDEGPTEDERNAMTALEKKILAVESLLRDGLQDNEVVITAKVGVANAEVMAVRLELIERALSKLRLALVAQAAVRVAQ